MEDLAKKFKNYTAFSCHFQPVTILKTGKDHYTAYYGGAEPENQIQHGSREYIEGWLYGAVQVACGQIRKRSAEENDGCV